MRSEVLDHFEATGLLDDMNEKEKLAILRQIDETQRQCKNELFEMHKANAEGKYVEKTASFSQILGQIESLKSKIQIVDIEKGLLELLEAHNKKVDHFTRKFSQNDLILDELSKLP